MKTLKLTVSHRGGGKSTTFSGRQEGKNVRNVLNIDQLDDDSEVYNIDVPSDTTSFNTSFFLGLFYDSISKMGSIDAFKQKYLFGFESVDDMEVREILLEDIDDGYRRANNELNGMTGLD